MMPVPSPTPIMDELLSSDYMEVDLRRQGFRFERELAEAKEALSVAVCREHDAGLELTEVKAELASAKDENSTLSSEIERLKSKGEITIEDMSLWAEGVVSAIGSEQAGKVTDKEAIISNVILNALDKITEE